MAKAKTNENETNETNENETNENENETTGEGRALHWNGPQGVINRAIAAALQASVDGDPDTAWYAEMIGATISGIAGEQCFTFGEPESKTYNRACSVARFLGLDYQTIRFGSARFLRVSRKSV